MSRKSSLNAVPCHCIDSGNLSINLKESYLLAYNTSLNDGLVILNSDNCRTVPVINRDDYRIWYSEDTGAVFEMDVF